MATYLTDDEIERLVALPKVAPPDFDRRVQAKQKRGHKEASVRLTSSTGEEFDLLVRRADLNALDFSVILRYLPPGTTTWFRLRRHNGDSHEHTNHLEHETFEGFHIHQATARYQEAGREADSYAQVTDRYAGFDGALDCMIEDANIALPTGNQSRLFEHP